MEDKVQILVIADDDHEDRLVLKMAMADVGLTASIVEKTDGREALHFFENECSVLQPSLIILDINMPVYTGLEVLEMARRNPSLCQTPVIVFTTSKDERDEARSFELGAAHFVSKPPNYSGYLKFAQELKAMLDDQATKD